MVGLLPRGSLILFVITLGLSLSAGVLACELDHRGAGFNPIIDFVINRPLLDNGVSAIVAAGCAQYFPRPSAWTAVDCLLKTKDFNWALNAGPAGKAGPVVFKAQIDRHQGDPETLTFF